LRDADPFPSAIDLIRSENALEIAWTDGGRTRYPGGQLRWACPCAECRGEAGAAGRLATIDELPQEELTLADVALVGQYALALSFASGHATGIYTFRYLRDLAPDEMG
jgi:DUF971 family protein